MNKKIALVINVDWYFSLHWKERAHLLKDKGNEIHVITNFTSLDIKDELISEGFICHDLKVIRKSVNVFSELITIKNLYSLIKDINPDIIHAITIKPNLYTGILNKLFWSKPIIYSITGLGAVYSSDKIKFRVLKRFISEIYKFVSTTNSKFIFENNDDFTTFSSLKILSDNGVVIKGAGIDLDKFKATPLKHTKRILFAARLLKDKGFYQLLSAKKILNREGIEIELAVAGIIDNDVSSAIPLQEIEELHQNKEINWLGNVKKMPDLIETSDIVVLPTLYGEGVPRILIEAAACARPIITSNIGGCREIVEHESNGFLVNPNDTVALANNIKLLLADEFWSESMGINGRKKVELEFSQEKVFRETLEIYNYLLSYK